MKKGYIWNDKCGTKHNMQGRDENIYLPISIFGELQSAQSSDYTGEYLFPVLWIMSGQPREYEWV